MKKATLVILILMLPLFIYSQNTLTIDTNRTVYFNSLDSALKYKEDVVILDLSGQRLKEIPIEILQFSNLGHLLLACKSIPYSEEEIVQMREKLEKKVGGPVIACGIIGSKGEICNRINKIDPRIYAGIGKLKKLNFVDLDESRLSKLEIKKLRDELSKDCQLYPYDPIFDPDYDLDELETP